MGTAIVFFSFPILTYILTGEREMILESYIPGIDSKTTRGYTITIIYHTMTIAIAVAGTSSSDALFVTLVAQLLPLCKLFDNSFDVMNVALIKNTQNKEEMKIYVKNLVKMHNEIVELVLNAN